MRTRKEWYDFCIKRGTSGDQVFDILRDWKEWDELEKISEANVLEIVDACFHAYASNFRTDARELAQEILGGY